jgi:FkbM family methyltransferase
VLRCLANCFRWRGGATAIKKAVGEKIGTAHFYRQNVSHLGGLLAINRLSADSLGYAANAENQCMQVDVTTLDHFTSCGHITSLDILKIDAQGYEVEVLRGARKILKKTTACSVEVSFYDFYERSSSLLLIEQEMQTAGMRLWDIAKLSKNPKNFRTDWAEFIYLRSTFPRV